LLEQAGVTGSRFRRSGDVVEIYCDRRKDGEPWLEVNVGNSTKILARNIADALTE
jgi:hypothetical protein